MRTQLSITNYLRCSEDKRFKNARDNRVVLQLLQIIAFMLFNGKRTVFAINTP
jgi:hypothetical protein